MTGQEIIRLARRKLDDFAEPYLWEDIELTDYLNLTINEICERARLITDSSTTALATVKIYAHLGIYSLDERVIAVKGARIPDKSSPLVLQTESTMDRQHTAWRDTHTPDATGINYIIPLIESNTVQKIQFYPTVYDDTGEVVGASNITFTSGTKTISMVGGAFTTHFEAGDTINVDGTTSNDGDYTAVTVADAAIVVSETLVTESLTSATLRRLETTATLTVLRYPLTQFSVDTLNSASPEMPYTYHSRLIDGIMMHAYEKEDADTYDQKKADRARARFEKTIEEIKRLTIRKYHSPGAIEVHKGAI